MPGVEGDFEMEMILDGSVMYMRSPMLSRSSGLDTDWISMDLEALAPGFSDLASLSQGQNDPTAQLEYLRGISDAEEVGTEQVAGVETTHYSGTVDLDAAYDRLPDDTRGELKQAIAQARKQFGNGAMPVDVWIDGDGLLRRMTISLESGGNSAVDFGMEMTMEIPEYGIAMHLPIPKDGDVTDVSDLLPLSRSALGLGQPAPHGRPERVDLHLVPDPSRDVRIGRDPRVEVGPRVELDHERRPDHVPLVVEHRSPDQDVTVVDEGLDVLQVDRSYGRPPSLRIGIVAVPCHHHEPHVASFARRIWAPVDPSPATGTAGRASPRHDATTATPRGGARVVGGRLFTSRVGRASRA